MGFDYYWRLTPRLSLHAGGLMTRFKFYQPTGRYPGWYTGGGFTPTFGLTYHFKPAYDRPGAIPNPPRFKPQPMVERKQLFIGEFEKQFLKQ